MEKIRSFLIGLLGVWTLASATTFVIFVQLNIQHSTSFRSNETSFFFVSTFLLASLTMMLITMD